MPGTVLIVAGGARPDPAEVGALPPIDFSVAADSGADHALSYGLAIDAVVGDMDSISEGGLAAVRDAGSEIRQFDTRKDQTDLELAFLRALDEQPDRIVVIGLGGGRLDHALANIGVLAADYGPAQVEAFIGSARLVVIRSSRVLHGAIGEVVSLLPVLGPVAGVTTEGLEYRLVAEPLEPSSARGVSNRFVETAATVTVTSGVLLAVQPDALKNRGSG